MSRQNGLHLRDVPVGDGAAALRRAIASRWPLKIANLTAGWEASSWTFDTLRAASGERIVKAMLELPRSGGVLAGGQAAYEREMTFSAFLDCAESGYDGKPCYLGYSRPADLIPGYDAAFDFPGLTHAGSEGTDTRLWVGSAGTCSGLHSDLKDNVFAQVYGTKRVLLVPFRESHRVYPFLDNIVNSQVDPDELDLRRFPKFVRATVMSTRVGPGDVIFIPRGWWHYIKSESPSISINHWFREPIPAPVFVAILLRLGPRYVGRTLVDLVRYGVLGREYRKDFFFTPASTGERLFNLLRYGDFSRENDPVASTS